VKVRVSEGEGVRVRVGEGEDEGRGDKYYPHHPHHHPQDFLGLRWVLEPNP
jgi:hypothetical protein